MLQQYSKNNSRKILHKFKGTWNPNCTSDNKKFPAQLPSLLSCFISIGFNKYCGNVGEEEKKEGKYCTWNYGCDRSKDKQDSLENGCMGKKREKRCRRSLLLLGLCILVGLNLCILSNQWFLDFWRFFIFHSQISLNIRFDLIMTRFE